MVWRREVDEVNVEVDKVNVDSFVKGKSSSVPDKSSVPVCEPQLQTVQLNCRVRKSE